MNSDLTFITNEKGQNLKERFEVLIKDTKFFDCYVSATFYVIKTGRINQKYLAALLNSKLTAFWLRHKGKMQGNNYQIDKEPILDLPIYKTFEKEQQTIIDLVDQIIGYLKPANISAKKKAKINDLEYRLNGLVYKLYGLTDEEIKIVEQTP